MPVAIYSWLDLRDNRQYDSTGIIAMSSIENQYLTRVIDSPWASQDEAEPMMRRAPVSSNPKRNIPSYSCFNNLTQNHQKYLQ